MSRVMADTATARDAKVTDGASGASMLTARPKITIEMRRTVAVEESDYY